MNAVSMRVPFLIAASAVFFLVSSCSPARITWTWSNEQYIGKELEKFIVVAVSDREGPRRVFEESLAGLLRERKLQALESYKVVPQVKQATLARLSDEIEQKNIEAIFTTRVVDVEKETIYHTTSQFPDAFHRHPYWRPYWRYGHYYRHYSYASQPVLLSVETRKKVRLETNLYDADGETLIWSAQSKTIDPESPRELALAVGPLLIEQLERLTIIRGKKGSH